jgi:cbb3-type cytochrome oxidase maturation protein
MEILYLLIPMSVVLVFVIGFVFWRSVKGGQFEDLEGPGYRILMDDDNAVEHARGDVATGVEIVMPNDIAPIAPMRGKLDPNQ